MAIFTKHDGTTFNCPFMRAPKLKAGYWWINVSPLGDAPQHFVEQVHIAESKFLFGHEPKNLMAMQYPNPTI